MKKYIGIVIVSAFMACTHSEKKATASADSTSSAAATVTTAVELTDAKTESIYQGYIALKNAFVASNSAAVKSTAATLSVALKAFQGCENTALIADKIAGTGDIKIQRKEFTALSSDVIAMFKHADIKKGSIYIQHCPMANNGEGGDWLSSEKKISNPYYGDKMLTCGAVLEELKTAKLK